MFDFGIVRVENALRWENNERFGVICVVTTGKHPGGHYCRKIERDTVDSVWFVHGNLPPELVD